MKVAPEILADLCRARAGDLLSPLTWRGTSLDKARLLWALCGVESSFGSNCSPRHEAGYCYGARYFNPAQTAKWGCLAHCSFGPWQVMFPNFYDGVSPLSLLWGDDGRVASDLCMSGAIGLLNKAIARGARNFGELVIAYNGPEHEADYSAKLMECYDRPMPGALGEAVG